MTPGEFERLNRYDPAMDLPRSVLLLAVAGLVGSCALQPTLDIAPMCAPLTLPALQAPATPTCANDELTSYDGLLVFAPHPDDEILGFAGLSAAYRAQGKPVEVVIVTDGDAYCEACQFWKNSDLDGPLCSASELSNFATPEIDSFAEIRRRESSDAASHLGLDAPEFLGYPDTGWAPAGTSGRVGRARPGAAPLGLLRLRRLCDLW